MTHRVLLVDDHPVVREGFKRLLEQPGLSICGEASNGREAIERVAALKPDLVLMDLSMPEIGGIEATREIRRRHPATKVVVVSLHESTQASMLAREAGADAYVAKSRAATELIETIRSVLAQNGFPKAASLAQRGTSGHSKRAPSAKPRA